MHLNDRFRGCLLGLTIGDAIDTDESLRPLMEGRLFEQHGDLR